MPLDDVLADARRSFGELPVDSATPAHSPRGRGSPAATGWEVGLVVKPPTDMARVMGWIERERLRQLAEVPVLTKTSISADLRLFTSKPPPSVLNTVARRVKQRTQGAAQPLPGVLGLIPTLMGCSCTHYTVLELGQQDFLTVGGTMNSTSGPDSRASAFLGWSRSHSTDLLTQLGLRFDSSSSTAPVQLAFSFARRISYFHCLYGGFNLSPKRPFLPGAHAGIRIPVSNVKNGTLNSGLSWDISSPIPKWYLEFTKDDLASKHRKFVVSAQTDILHESSLTARWLISLSDEDRLYIQGTIEKTSVVDLEAGISSQVAKRSRLGVAVAANSEGGLWIRLRVKLGQIMIAVPIEIFRPKQHHWTFSILPLFAAAGGLLALRYHPRLRSVRKAIRHRSVGRLEQESKFKINILREEQAAARSHQRFMSAKAIEIRGNQEARGGLVILEARYGCDPAQPLDRKELMDEFPRVEDVTNAVQFWVDNSTASLELGAFPRSSMLGFYKTMLPAKASEEDRALFIRYKYDNVAHEVIIRDYEAARLPDHHHRRNPDPDSPTLDEPLQDLKEEPDEELAAEKF